MRVLFLCLLSGLLLTLTSCHVGRFFIWNFSDTNDQYKFPSEPVAKSDEPFHFIPSPPDIAERKAPKKVSIMGQPMDFEQALTDNKTVALLIIHKDTIVYEKYFRKYEEDTPHTSFSMAKSFVSALMGIAIEEGYIKSVNDPITNYLDDFKNDGFEKITIQDLLDMRSGIKFEENYFSPFGLIAKYYYGLNIKKYTRNLEIARPADERFDYRSIDTQILSLILEKATGRPVFDYLEEKIWQPLGMEYDASWSVDSKRNKTAKAYCCLNARTRDFAKFGRLYLNKGNWQGRQIVPEAWVDAATHYKAKNNFRYSNQWWHRIDIDRSTLTDGQPAIHYFALGHLGQYIYVHPEKEVIIVRLGKNYGK
ncbi:MAG: serine hydrolase, partial [Lewinella sp.]|nr:serine hydrolase [Lewinella sp.]